MLKDRYPQIEQLIVEMQFIDPLALGTYSPTLHSFGPPAKAFLGVPCPRTLCLEGGFEIEPIVLRLLRSGGTCASGTIVCCGTIKQLEIGPTQCQLQMNYRVEVRYERVMKEA
ncbi:MAG TPA: hypothetical protein VFB54_02905 [Burkholderiales bacterium]|nr:hypothetical protein [Burkholderiales bacterium]